MRPDLASENPALNPPAIQAVPPTHARDLAEFARQLRDQGLRESLRYLNLRTPHRFTGVFRFDGEMLRNVTLIDKWVPGVEVGEDVPLAEAYCAHLKRTGEPLQVAHGPSDSRVPWMAGSRVVSYCGAVIDDDRGQRWGALCHFDTATCEAKNSDMPLLGAAATLIYQSASSPKT